MMPRNLTQSTADAYTLCCCMQVSSDGQFRYANSRWFATALERLKLSGVHGMAIDVWVSFPCPTSFPACECSAALATAFITPGCMRAVP